jgi:cell division septum initiation protein DivIVA
MHRVQHAGCDALIGAIVAAATTTVAAAATTSVVVIACFNVKTKRMVRKMQEKSERIVSEKTRAPHTRLVTQLAKPANQ